MNKSEVLHSLQEIGLVPVLRADSVGKALAIAGAIAELAASPSSRSR